MGLMNPHKGLSNCGTGDVVIQLRQYGIETIILYGMSENMYKQFRFAVDD